MSASSNASAQHRRRILTLDGGGIRGALSLGVLREVERSYREERGDPDLVLGDVFDLIAGTSTGAIIATCLAWGMSVDETLDLYRTRGRAMFRPARTWQLVRAKYRADAIAETFRSIFVEDSGEPALLGSSRLRSLLLVVMRNATTGSPWPLCSNPDAKYNDRAHPECNLDIPLWRLLRASTAAPTFFPPERIEIGSQEFVFIDGGVTPHNNPSLIALLTATLPEYRVGWNTGPDDLFLLSIGTGHARSALPVKPAERLNLIDHMRYLPPALIGSFVEHQDALCRVLGECVHGDPLDSELGDLRGQGPIPRAQRLCSYARINPRLERAIPLDDVARVDELATLGARAAEAINMRDVLR
ncbi:MAG: patatin-like phospholipase family protein [Phycisphaerales bacterium]